MRSPAAAGRAAFLDDLQGPEVVRAGIFMSEARGGLPGRQERVLEGVLPCRCSRGQEMRRDLRRGTRSCSQRAGDRQVDRDSGRRAEAIDDGLAVKIVGEPRLGVARDDTGPTGLVQKAKGRRLVRGHPAAHQQAEVDVAARDGRPLEQPHAFGGQPGQPSPQRLRDAGRDLGLLVPRALRDQQPGQLPDEERVAAAALPQLGA